MLAGFLLLKLPVATMVNGSVSLAEQNGFPQGAVGKKREKFAKARKKCKGSSESPASPERTSPGTALPEGGISLGSSS